jgi:hypothetical protein
LWPAACPSTSRVGRRDESFLPRIQVLKAEHLIGGYRRIWARGRFLEQLPVSKEQILRLLRQHHSMVRLHMRLRAKSTSTVSKLWPTRPGSW